MGDGPLGGEWQRRQKEALRLGGGEFREEGLAAFRAASPCVSSRQCLLRPDGAVVDADVVDQAGPEGAGGLVAAAADEKAGVAGRQVRLRVCGGQDAVHIQPARGAVPGQADAMPVAVRDDGSARQRAAGPTGALELGPDGPGRRIGHQHVDATLLREDALSGRPALDPGQDAEGPVRWIPNEGHDGTIV